MATVDLRPAMPVPVITVRAYGQDGPLVAVLHGGPGAAGSCAGLARDLSSFARVLEPLQRRSGTVPLTVAQHVADLAGALFEPAILVGWSWGAMLGLSFATAHPELVRSLVLVGCGTYDQASRDAYHRTMNERLGPVGRERNAQLEQQLREATGPHQQDSILAQIGGLDEHAQAFDLIEESSDVDIDAAGHAETWSDVIRLQDAGVEPAVFSTITCPVLMVHGDTDPHPGRSTYEILRQFVPQIEYREFDQCGHAPWRERWGREPFLGMIQDWVTAGDRT
jgi:pimeloyl-ACP methyl ester carboxylesterase